MKCGEKSPEVRKSGSPKVGNSNRKSDVEGRLPIGNGAELQCPLRHLPQLTNNGSVSFT